MTLYHYTSEPGFNEIVLNDSMRLRNSTESNDKRDTVHIHDLINEDITMFNINDEVKENRIIEIILDVFNNFESSRLSFDENEKSEKVFVTCFTPKIDDRFLWTAYSGDIGYCLGFNEEKLKELFQSESIKMQLSEIATHWLMIKIIYDKESQKQLIKNIIEDEYKKFLLMPKKEISDIIPELKLPYQFVFTDESGVPVYEGKKKEVRFKIRKNFESMIVSIIEELLLISPMLKNSYWNDENETRLALYRPFQTNYLKKVDLDERGRRFVTFQGMRSVLEEIIIGPKNTKTIEEIQQTLLSYGYDLNKLSIRYSNGKDVLR